MGCQVSVQGDVYSFGILLLEILTGRKPTDEMFTNDMNLHSFVKVSLPDKLLDIVDSTLLPRELEQATVSTTEEEKNNSDQKQCLLELFYIGLACSVESPRARINMKIVTRELDVIKIALSRK